MAFSPRNTYTLNCIKRHNWRSKSMNYSIAENGIDRCTDSSSQELMKWSVLRFDVLSIFASPKVINCIQNPFGLINGPDEEPPFDNNLYIIRGLSRWPQGVAWMDGRSRAAGARQAQATSGELRSGIDGSGGGGGGVVYEARRYKQGTSNSSRIFCMSKESHDTWLYRSWKLDANKLTILELSHNHIDL